MQDSTLEIIGKQQIAAAADMKDRTGQLLELYVHKISHRIIFHETAGLHLHTEGVHLSQILIVFGLYHIVWIPGQAGDDGVVIKWKRLSYFGSVAECLLRSDETHLSVILASHEDHTLRLDATDLARSKVRKDAYLLADHLLWRILFGDA